MTNTKIEPNKFFWFFHITILILAIYGIAGLFFLSWFSNPVVGVFSYILGLAVLGLNIYAIIRFRKSIVLMRVLPIGHFIHYGLNLILGIIMAMYLLQKRDITSITLISTIITLVFNIFRVALSSYIIYKFKKN